MCVSDGGVRGCYGVCYRVSEAKGGGERGERWVGGARLHCGRPELGPMVHGCNGRVKCHHHPDPFVSGIPASSGSVVSLPPLFCPCPCSPSCDLSPSSSVAALSCCCSGCSGRWWWWHWVGGWWQAGWWHRLLCTPAVSSRGKQ